MIVRIATFDAMPATVNFPLIANAILKVDEFLGSIESSASA